MTVQFQSVAEKLTPHDTIFTFESASELRDTKLSAACSLHTASASIKSSSESLPQRGLAEIAEDALESPIAKAHNGDLLKNGEGSNEDRLNLTTNRRTSGNGHHSQAPSVTSRSPPRPRTASSHTDKALPQPPAGQDKARPRSILDYGDSETRPSVERRFSSQSARPSTKDLHNTYEYKPKVKLGPRPSMDHAASRLEKPDGAGNYRPVSTLPPGLRMPPRKVALGRPKSSQAQSSFSNRTTTRQPLPPAPVTPIRIPDRNVAMPNLGLPTPVKTPELKSPKMSPEKLRLMKALQLRQKQMAAQKTITGLEIEALPSEQENTSSELDDTDIRAVASELTPPAEPVVERICIQNLSQEDHRDVEASPVSVPETCEEPSTQASSITDEEEASGRKKQDSNLNVESSPSIPTTLESAKPPLFISEPANLGPAQLPLNAEAEDLQGQLVSGGDSISMAEGHEVEFFDETLQNEREQQYQPSLSSKEPLTAEDEQLLRENRPKKHDPALRTGGSTSAIHNSQFNIEETPSKGLDAEEDVIQTVPTGAIQKLPNQGSQTQHKSVPQDVKEHVRTLGSMKNIAPIVANEALHHVIPSEVPLPAIDEHEQASLSPLQPANPASPPALWSSSKSKVESSTAPSIENCQSQSSNLTATQPPLLDDFGEQAAASSVRRQGVVDPILRATSPDHFEEQFLSDESFMEELKSATLQEAKPISVSKSPIRPVFSRPESEKALAETRSARSVSSPLTHQSRDEETFPPRLLTPSSARSFSTSQSHHLQAQRVVPPLPKKIGVSTGISQRIKALEQLSARPSSPPLQAASPNMSAFVSLRKTPQRTPPSASEVGHTSNNMARPSTSYPSTTSSPETISPHTFKQFSKPGNPRPESVTVTATIVRDAKNRKPGMPLNPSEPRATDLHQSPLLVEHQPMSPPPLSPLKPPRPRYARYSSARSGSSSSTDQKGEASPTRRRDSFASILSKSSRATSEPEVPRTTSDSALNGANSPDGTKEEKKDSRRSRLMKRMSSMSSMSRRSIAQALSPSPKESPIMEHHEPIVDTPILSSIAVGDVNVQFPDTLVCFTLLWLCNDG